MARSKHEDPADEWLDERPRMDLEDLHQWCAIQNQRKMSIRLSWWYFVRKGEDGGHFIDKMEGWRADEARARAAMRPPEYYRAPPEDTAAIHAFVRRCMDQGMEPWEFSEFVKRTGGAERVVADGELV